MVTVSPAMFHYHMSLSENEKKTVCCTTKWLILKGKIAINSWLWGIFPGGTFTSNRFLSLRGLSCKLIVPMAYVDLYTKIGR